MCCVLGVCVSFFNLRTCARIPMFCGNLMCFISTVEAETTAAVPVLYRSVVMDFLIDLKTQTAGVRGCQRPGRTLPRRQKHESTCTRLYIQQYYLKHQLHSLLRKYNKSILIRISEEYLILCIITVYVQILWPKPWHCHHRVSLLRCQKCSLIKLNFLYLRCFWHNFIN